MSVRLVPKSVLSVVAELHVFDCERRYSKFLTNIRPSLPHEGAVD